MNERQLRALKLAVKTGTLVQAARLMHVSAPAVSQMLTALEQEIGISLLNRRQGRVSPTPQGLYFLEAADKALSTMEATRDVARMLRTSSHGQIRVSTTPGMSLKVLPRVFARFSKVYPTCEVSVQARTSPRTVDLIAHQVIDIGIADAPFFDEIADPIVFESPLRCVFSASHPLRAKDYVTPEDLTEISLVMLSKDLLPTQLLMQTFKDANIEIDPKSDCNLFYSVIATALHSNMVGFAPGVAATGELDGLPFESRPYYPTVNYKFAVLQSMAQELLDENQLFLDILIEELNAVYQSAI